MSLAAFDTLKFARTLRDSAHFSSEQAEGLTAAIAEAVQEGLPAKTEVQAEFASVRSEMRTEFAAIRAEMAAGFAAIRAEMKILEQSMTIKLGAMLLAMTGIVVAAILYLPPAH